MGKHNIKKGHIKNELIFGLIIIVLISSLGTFFLNVLLSKKNFDYMVEQNDIAAAKLFADSLADYYHDNGSWKNIDNAVQQLKKDPQFIAPYTESSFQKRRQKKDIPLILTNCDGKIIYSGFRNEGGQVLDNFPTQLNVNLGEKVLNGKEVVGYIFFKSMVFSSYNPRENEFIRSLGFSVGLSVLLGLLLSFCLGTYFASRFVRPILKLESAVKEFSSKGKNSPVNVGINNEIGSLAGSFNLMAERLYNTEQERQNLLADIAHELRTPVSIIQANLEMMIEGVYKADNSRLTSLYEETKLLTHMIEDLRTISDLELGIDTAKIEPVLINSFLTSSIQRFVPLYEERKIKLVLEKLSTDFYVQADALQLNHVFRNILDNALKYSFEGSRVFVKIEEKKQKGSNKIIVTVLDEGPGVLEEELPKIFERFYRTDRSRNRESGGRGLGLAICKQLIESSGGSIGAYNRKPNGLAVWFELNRA